MLCPVPRVLPPLVEPEVVPRFLAALEQVWRGEVLWVGGGGRLVVCEACVSP